MDPQQVKHCVLDLDKVSSPEEAAAWFKKWREPLRTYLTRDGKDLLHTNQRSAEAWQDRVAGQ